MSLARSLFAGRRCCVAVLRWALLWYIEKYNITRAYKKRGYNWRAIVAGVYTAGGILCGGFYWWTLAGYGGSVASVSSLAPRERSPRWASPRFAGFAYPLALFCLQFVKIILISLITGYIYINIYKLKRAKK